MLWSDIRDGAHAVREEVTEIEDSARRLGIIPGIMRTLRSKYRLDWSGWDR
jgi:hypothetical protein